VPRQHCVTNYCTNYKAGAAHPALVLADVLGDGQEGLKACWSLLGVEYLQQADARREEQHLFPSPELEVDQVPPLNSSCSYPK
jgi:hypothetical protein